MIEMYEEFAGSHQEGPTLSLDIWNKFPLLPTPPRSPSHDSSQYDENNLTPSLEDATLLELLPLEHDFRMVDLENMNLDRLPDPLVYSCGLSGMPCARPCTSCTQLALAGSELRHDCMWRGTCTAEAHSYTREQHAHSHTHAHTDSLTGVSDMYLDSHPGFDALDFAPLHFRADDQDSDDDDDGLGGGGEEYEGRPETPSESSETDTDEDQDEDDDYYDEITDYNTGGASPSQVHVDHSYYCIRAPSPRLAATPTYPHTPSESEDEIDVVSLGSPDSAYSSGSDNMGSTRTELITTIDTASTTTTTAKLTTRISRKRIRSGGEASKHNAVIPTPAVPSINTTPALPTSTATTTFVTAQGSRKMLKIRTFNPKSKDRKARQESGECPNQVANGTSYDGGVETSSTATHKRSTKSKKSSKHHYSNKKRKGGRSSEANDPVKRKLHNSMERMRRVDLRKCFDELRRRVPSLHDKDKAPKVEILRKASEHCYFITQRARLLELEKEKQRKLRSELRKKLKLSKLALQ